MPVAMLSVVLVVTPICGLAGLALTLRFLRHVYDRGGASDVVKVARAVRESQLRGLLRTAAAGIDKAERSASRFSELDVPHDVPQSSGKK